MRVATADIPAPCALVEIDGHLTLVLSDELPSALKASLTQLLATVDARLNVEPAGVPGHG